MGALLILAIQSSTSGNVSVAGLGSTWTNHGEAVMSGTRKLEFWSAPYESAAPGTITITASAASSTQTWHLAEITGGAVVAGLASASGTSPTVASAPVGGGLITMQFAGRWPSTTAPLDPQTDVDWGVLNGASAAELGWAAGSVFPLTSSGGSNMANPVVEDSLAMTISGTARQILPFATRYVAIGGEPDIHFVRLY